jgi:excisionase family DNA binding protein
LAEKQKRKHRSINYCNVVSRGIYVMSRGGTIMARHKQTTDTVADEQETTVPEASRDLLTVREVAKHLRVDDTTVRRWIKSGALDAVALPHSGKRCGYRVRKHTLDALFSTPSTTNAPA